MFRYAVVTFGCRVNQADSMEIDEHLHASGGQPSTAERADVIIVNTCSVTASADQGARQTIRRIARDNPCARIVVTGCYATRKTAEVADLPSVVKVVPNGQKSRLVQALTDLSTTTAERFGDGDGACGARIAPGVLGRTAHTLRVQTGCDQTCSYCIIPSTRGRGISRPPDEVESEVARIARAGFKEVILTGVHLGSYGRDLEPATNLGSLLRRLDDSPGDLLFRISSLEPMDCSLEIVDLIRQSPRFAPSFHLPLQHASDSLLAAMRRPYTRDEYHRLVSTIRSSMPHASIGTDVIIGFPGETAADAQQMLDYLSESPLTRLHVFPYSDRPGTEASSLLRKVEGAVIRQRAAAVRGVGERLTRRFRESQVGQIRPALTIDDGSLAITDNYLRVRIPPGRSRNEWVRVRMNACGETMTGELVSS